MGSFILTKKVDTPRWYQSREGVANKASAALFDKLRSVYKQVDLIPMKLNPAGVLYAQVILDRKATKQAVKIIAGEAGWATLEPGDEDVVSDPVPPRVRVIPPLTAEVMREHFAALHGLDPYIRLLHDSLAHKQHCLLYGPPGVAKTKIFLAYHSWLTDKMVWRVDAPTVSKAGFETKLIEKCQRGKSPAAIIIEEIEKCTAATFSTLLQIMDDRSMIQRTNCKQNVTIPVNCVVWATCNGIDRLRKMHAGALASRFTLKLECREPDDVTLLRVLSDACGDSVKVREVFNYMRNTLNTRDARLGKMLLKLSNLSDYEKCRGTL